MEHLLSYHVNESESGKLGVDNDQMTLKIKVKVIHFE